MTPYIKVRANGGWLIHIKSAEPGGKSLCGHQPADRCYQMRKRGRWLVLYDQDTVPTCKKCRTHPIAIGLYGAI